MSVPGLFDRLIMDAAVADGRGPVADAVSAHREHRAGPDATALGPLVVPDDRLAEVGRALAEDPGAEPLEVCVRVGGGAGGLIALARRDVPGVVVTAAWSALRDLDDPAGNAARVVAAAEELDGVGVFVELPDAPGWIGAVEEIEAAGLSGALRVDGAGRDAARSLAERMSVLVEADLPFALTGDLGGAVSTPVAPGVVPVLLALEALIDGAEPAEAAELLGLADEQRIATALQQWDDATATRVRRRLRAVSAVAAADVVAGLRGLGLLSP